MGDISIRRCWYNGGILWAKTGFFSIVILHETLRCTNVSVMSNTAGFSSITTRIIGNIAHGRVRKLLK